MEAFSVSENVISRIIFILNNFFQVLIIENNNLTELPAALGSGCPRLVHVINFVYAQCHFQHLQIQISVGGNQLNSLPSSLGALSLLQVVICFIFVYFQVLVLALRLFLIIICVHHIFS